MKKLTAYLGQHIGGYLFAILSMMIAVSLDLLSPQLTRHIVDDVIVGGEMEKLKYLLGGILAVGVLFAIRKFLYISQLDKTSRQKLRLARIVTGKSQRTPEPKEEASGTQEEKAD